MKRIALGVVLIARVVLAQDEPSPEQRQRQARQLAETLTQLQGKGEPINFSAFSTQRDKSVLHLKGNVRITSGTFSMSADEVDYHWDTGEIETRGKVLWKCTTPIGSTDATCSPLRRGVVAPPAAPK